MLISPSNPSLSLVQGADGSLTGSVLPISKHPAAAYRPVSLPCQCVCAQWQCPSLCQEKPAHTGASGHWQFLKALFGFGWVSLCTSSGKLSWCFGAQVLGWTELPMSHSWGSYELKNWAWTWIKAAGSFPDAVIHRQTPPALAQFISGWSKIPHTGSRQLLEILSKTAQNSPQDQEPFALWKEAIHAAMEARHKGFCI